MKSVVDEELDASMERLKLLVKATREARDAYKERVQMLEKALHEMTFGDKLE